MPAVTMILLGDQQPPEMSSLFRVQALMVLVLLLVVLLLLIVFNRLMARWASLEGERAERHREESRRAGDFDEDEQWTRRPLVEFDDPPSHHDSE